MFIGIEWAIVGAAGGLISSHIAARFFLPTRVRAESTAAPMIESAPAEKESARGCGRPIDDLGQVARVRGAGSVEAGGSREGGARYYQQPPDAYMPAVEHIERFIADATTDEDGRAHTERKKQNGWHYLYLQWCARADVNVVPLPEQTWQTLMKKHERVAWKRDPRKCPATGRILRKASGAPERDTYYTISPPRAQPVLPGKVPVAELVPVRAVETKSQRQRARQVAASANGQGKQVLPEVGKQVLPEVGKQVLPEAGKQWQQPEQPLPGANADWASEAPSGAVGNWATEAPRKRAA